MSLTLFVGRNQGANSVLQLSTQWGCKKRKNRSIINIGKSMIHGLELPTRLWAKACLRIIYILKSYPHKVLMDKTLEEAFMAKCLGYHIFMFLRFIFLMRKEPS